MSYSTTKNHNGPFIGKGRKNKFFLRFAILEGVLTRKYRTLLLRTDHATVKITQRGVNASGAMTCDISHQERFNPYSMAQMVEVECLRDVRVAQLRPPVLDE